MSVGRESTAAGSEALSLAAPLAPLENKLAVPDEALRRSGGRTLPTNQLYSFCKD